MAGSDRIAEARLEEAPVGVADVLAVIRDADDPVLADPAWTRSPAPDLAVVRLALELSAHSIGRLVVVLELGELWPQLLFLLQRPLGAAGAPDGARRQRVVVLARDEAARLAPDEPELDLPPRAVGLVAIVVHHVVVIAAVLVLVVSVDDATVVAVELREIYQDSLALHCSPPRPVCRRLVGGCVLVVRCAALVLGDALSVHEPLAVDRSPELEEHLAVQALHVILLRRRLDGRVEDAVDDDAVAADTAHHPRLAFAAFLDETIDLVRLERQQGHAAVHLLLGVARRSKLARQGGLCSSAASMSSSSTRSHNKLPPGHDKSPRDLPCPYALCDVTDPGGGAELSFKPRVDDVVPL